MSMFSSHPFLQNRNPRTTSCVMCGRAAGHEIHVELTTTGDNEDWGDPLCNRCGVERSTVYVAGVPYCDGCEERLQEWREAR